MKKKVILIIVLVSMALTSCDIIPGLGKEKVPTPEIQELKPEPTESNLPEKGAYFRDEFDEDINKDWGMKIISGLEEQLVWSQKSGKFRLQMLPPNDTNYVFMRKDTNYDDVIVQAEVENFGPTENAFSLICRASELGWYEFRISSQGYYEVLRFDQYLKNEGKNAYTNLVEKRIGSALIKGGLEKNVFSLSCIGDQITVFINGEQPYKDKRPLIIEDDTYANGNVGFGFLGYGKELDVTYNWVGTLKLG